MTCSWTACDTQGVLRVACASMYSNTVTPYLLCLRSTTVSISSQLIYVVIGSYTLLSASHIKSHNHRVARQHSWHNFSGISSPAVLYALAISLRRCWTTLVEYSGQKSHRESYETSGYTKDNREYPIPPKIQSAWYVFSFMSVEVKNKDELEVVLCDSRYVQMYSGC